MKSSFWLKFSLGLVLLLLTSCQPVGHVGDKSIAYRTGYKYQLSEPAWEYVRIYPPEQIGTDNIVLLPDGMLVIAPGYAWDGPSGPTIDTASFMRCSVIHDALYELLRKRLLPPETRAIADEELIRICGEDGMWWLRQKWVYLGVHTWGAPSADPVNDKPVLRAP